MNFTPHIFAEIRLLLTNQGGRKQPTPADEFGCPVRVAGELFDTRMDLRDTGSLSPGATARVPIRFLRPDFVRPLIQIGSEFTLWEMRMIGHGRVLQIYESMAA